MSRDRQYASRLKRDFLKSQLDKITPKENGIAAVSKSEIVDLLRVVLEEWEEMDDTGSDFETSTEQRLQSNKKLKSQGWDPLYFEQSSQGLMRNYKATVTRAETTAAIVFSRSVDQVTMPYRGNVRQIILGIECTPLLHPSNRLAIELE